jgi:sulfur carrier protein
MIFVTVNGQPREVPDGLNIATLVEELGFAGKRVAIELNGQIVPRSRHHDTKVASADQIEIVVAVGGG